MNQVSEVLAVGTSATTTVTAPRVSYRQLTEAQVLGARDRSKRQVEYHQSVCQLEQVNDKWKRMIDLHRHHHQRNNTYKTDDQAMATATAIATATSSPQSLMSVSYGDMYHRAIVDAFEGNDDDKHVENDNSIGDDGEENSTTSNNNRQQQKYRKKRELSPILIARLANLCYHEYHNIQISKSVKRMEDDYNLVIIDWYNNQLRNEQNQGPIERQQAILKQIEIAKSNIVELHIEKQQEFQQSNFVLKQQLIQQKKYLIERIKEQQQKQQEQQQKKIQIQHQRETNDQSHSKGSHQSNSHSLNTTTNPELQQYQKLLSITSHRELAQKNNHQEQKQQHHLRQQHAAEEETATTTSLSTTIPETQQWVTCSTSSSSSSSSNIGDASCSFDWVDVDDHSIAAEENNDIHCHENNTESYVGSGVARGGRSTNDNSSRSKDANKNGRSSSLSDWIVCS